jgi:hypothetical protein
LKTNQKYDRVIQEANQTDLDSEGLRIGIQVASLPHKRSYFTDDEFAGRNISRACLKLLILRKENVDVN